MRHMSELNTCRRSQNRLAIIAFAVLCCLAIILTIIPMATAVQPDSGQILGTLQKQPQLERPQRLPKISAPTPDKIPATADKITIIVKSFSLVGNKQIATSMLRPLVDRHIGKELVLSDLYRIISDINAFYRDAGFLTSSAYLPAQDASNGKVQIKIIEGRLSEGGIRLKIDTSRRINETIALNVLKTAIPEGDIIKKKEVERGLLLLNDLPSIAARSTLTPGASIGTSDLVVEINEGNLISGSIEADNFGGRYTGKLRGGGTININNPSGRGDLAGLRFTHSQNDMAYVRGFYQHPVGPYGTMLGIAASWMNYRLGEEFKDNDSSGESYNYGVYLTHPLIRNRHQNLKLSTAFDVKKLTDETFGVTTMVRDIQVARIGITGDLTTQTFTPSRTSYSLTYVGGNLDLSGVPSALEADQLTTKTDGTFQLLNGSITHTNYLPGNFSIHVSGRGQLPFNNLDSSEKFSLGGPGSVRAYPQGEASGDGGYILSSELRYDQHQLIPNHQLQSYVFVDHGQVWLNRNTWVDWQGSNSELKNNYSLNGAGIGCALSKAGKYFIRASYAWTIGDNIGNDSNNTNSEGKNPGGQFWLQVAYWF